MKKKILFITGSMNQTTQMYQIAKELSDCDCWYKLTNFVWVGDPTISPIKSRLFREYPVTRYNIPSPLFSNS